MKQDTMCVIPAEYNTERMRMDSEDKAKRTALRKLKKKDGSSQIDSRKQSMGDDPSSAGAVADEEKLDSSSDSSSDSDDDFNADLNQYTKSNCMMLQTL